MKILIGCGAAVIVVAAAILVYCLYFLRAPSPTLIVTNNFTQPIDRVALKDGTGILCSVTNVAPGATKRCSGAFRQDGPVYFELEAGKLKKSSLIGFGKPGMSVVFDVEFNRNGSVGWGATVSSIAIGYQPAKQH